MATATIGGLIKDYRLQKRLSQLEISLSIGWSDTTRLSKIEQGRVGRPTRETVEKIIKALGLTSQEKGEFLLVGGYVPENEEIKQIIKTQAGENIDSWPYPAYLLDFTWRLLYINDLALAVYGMDPSWKDKIRNNLINILSFPFLPKTTLPVEIEQGENENNLQSYAVAQVAAFKKENSKFAHESWYNKLIQELMQYPEFRSLWPKITENQFSQKLHDYEYKRIKLAHEGEMKVIDFRVFGARLVEDRRFIEILFIPADKRTYKNMLELTDMSNI